MRFPCCEGDHIKFCRTIAGPCIESMELRQITSKQKTARRRRLLNSNLMILDQAAINAGFDLRRYVMKPTPAKPRSIMAHVDVSGTADVGLEL